MPAIKTPRDDIMSPKEILKTLKDCNNSQVQAFISLLWLTGARIGEIKMLKAQDITNQANFIQIEMPTLKTRVKTTMPRRRLKIPKDNVFYNFFKQWINENTFADEDLIFDYSIRYIRRKLKEANPDTYPHLFRHTLATMLSREVDAFTLKEWFGWRTMDMPMRYVHRKDAMESVYNVLGEKMK